MRSYSYDGNTQNWTNTTSDTVVAGQVVQVATGWFGIALRDIEPDDYQVLHTTGAFKFPVPNGTTLNPGADFTFDVATQAYAGGGVAIGRVMEQIGNTAHVLINSLPGGVR